MSLSISGGGLAARSGQTNSFQSRLQGLMASARAQMDDGGGSKYTNALKASQAVEQGLALIGDTEVQKASQANLDQMKERMAEQARQAQEQKAAEAARAAQAETEAAQSGEPGQAGDGSAAGRVRAEADAGVYNARGERPTASAGTSGSSDGGGGSPSSSGGQTQVDVVV